MGKKYGVSICGFTCVFFTLLNHHALRPCKWASLVATHRSITTVFFLFALCLVETHKSINGGMVPMSTCAHVSSTCKWWRRWVVHTNFVSTNGKSIEMSTWWFYAKTSRKLWSPMKLRPFVNLKRLFFFVANLWQSAFS